MHASFIALGPITSRPLWALLCRDMLSCPQEGGQGQNLQAREPAATLQETLTYEFSSSLQGQHHYLCRKL